MKDRIKIIRKDKKLTQEDFGKQIGVRGNTITNYENGMRNPSSAIINSICREFNVNENWLRTGEGDMYNLPTDDVAAIVSELLEESNPLYDTIVEIIKTYQTLDKDSKTVILNFIRSVHDAKGGS